MIRLHTITRSPFARKIRRHRRPVAAALAGLSVLCIISAVRPAPVVESERPPVVALQADEVAVPISLAHPAIASALHIGDTVDVIARTEAGDETVASDVTVMEVLETGIVMLAANAQQGSRLAAASLDGQLTVTIHGSAASAR